MPFVAQGASRGAEEGRHLHNRAPPVLLEVAVYYVYLLRSLANPRKSYIGLTDDLKARVRKHNEGGSPHTAKWRPWELVAYVALQDRQRAVELEKYFKVGSGHAWAHRHLW